MTTDTQKPRWVDTTISVQTLILWVAGASGAAVLAWFSLIGRVSTLEEHDRQHEQHFTRIESDMQQQRADVKEQLRSISSDVKDTNTKIDQLRDQLLSNSVGNRPDIKRWSK